MLTGAIITIIIVLKMEYNKKINIWVKIFYRFVVLIKNIIMFLAICFFVEG